MRADRREERARFNAEIRWRIDLVAADCGLPRSAVAWVRGRLRHQDLVLFAQEHSVAIDWLICGTLTGLARTIVARRTRSAGAYSGSVTGSGWLHIPTG
jgi:hypothetical protein